MKWLLILMIVFWTQKGFSQFVLDDKVYVDSLKRELASPVSDSVKAYTCFNLASYYQQVSDWGLFAQYLELVRFYNKRNNPFLQAVYYALQAGELAGRDVAAARSLCIKVDSLLKPYHDKIALLHRAKIWGLYGYTEELKDDHTHSLAVTLNKCIPLATAAGDMGYAGVCYAYIGLDFTSLLEYAKADAYYARGIRTCGNSPNRSYLLYVYLKAAENDFYRDSLNSAKQFLDSSRKILRPYPQSHFYIEYDYDEAIYYISKKQFPESVSCIKKGITVAKNFGQDYQAQRLLFLEQQAYTGEGNYAAARDILLYLIDHRDLRQAQNNLYYYAYLSDVYVHLKNYEQAYQWQKKYSTLLDSTRKSGVANNMNDLEAKYRTSEKEKQIMQLAGEKRQAQLLLGTGCLLLLLGVIFAVLLYRNGKRQRQLHVAQAMLDGEDRERMRVAQDLHDGLGGMLAGVKLNLSGWMESRQEDRTLSKVIDQLDDAASELRKIARNMMPETLLKYGLETAVGELCDFYVSTKCRITLQALGLKPDIPLSVQMPIYRIIQELLSNAVKHAAATKVMVQCSQNGSLFLITVEDNGKGFDLSAMDASNGLGLRNLKNRVAFLKGKIDFHSTADGTTVNIELNVYENRLDR